MKQISLKNIIIAAASVVGLVGVFLPWVSASAFGISITANGTDGSDGWIILALFVVPIVLALINLKKEMAIGYKIGITAVSALIAIIAIVKIIDIMGAGIVSAGIGLFVILIGSVASAVLPWTPIKKML